MKLTVKKRENKNEDSAKVMGVVYGGLSKNTSIIFASKDFEKIYEKVGTSGLIELDVEGEKIEVVIKDIQLDHRTENFHHIDFYAVTRGQKMEAEVAFDFIGEAEAVKKGGVVNISLTEMTIKSLPKDLPSAIKINLEELTDIGQSIKLSDLTLPTGVSYLDDADLETSIVSILEAKSVEDEEKANEGEPDLTEESEEKEGGEKESKKEEKKSTDK